MPKASKERVSKAHSGPSSKQKPPIKQEGEQRIKPEPEQVDIKLSATPRAPAPPPENYLFLTRLRGTSNPTITRFLSVPSCYTFDHFHEVLQIAFGWANYHMYQFKVMKIREANEPLENRFFRQYGDAVLLELVTEDFLEDALEEDPKMQLVTEYSLRDVFDGEEYRDKIEVLYEYDMGDGWEHEVLFLGKESGRLRMAISGPAVAVQGNGRAVCLGGEGHPCAEDCGGPMGWEELKAIFGNGAYRGNAGVAEQQRLKAWYNTDCVNGDRRGLDPYKWGVVAVNAALMLA